MTSSMIWRAALAASLPLALGIGAPASANNYGESLAWQFRTSADRVNAAAVLDLIEKRKGGGYAAPAYTTTIERQYNCSVNAAASGNSQALSAFANAPTLEGAAASAGGNASTASADEHAGISAGQTNSGSVTAAVEGTSMAIVTGSPEQALNAGQDNSGNQYASITGAGACLLAGRP